MTFGPIVGVRPALMKVYGYIPNAGFSKERAMFPIQEINSNWMAHQPMLSIELWRSRPSQVRE